MYHSLQIEGFGVRLRPVRMEDAAFIVWVRNLERSKGKIGDSAGDIVAQQAWLAAYFERENDYYFIIESARGVPAGTLGIYAIAGRSGELGRLVVRPGSLASLPGTLLGYDLAYRNLELAEIRGTVVASNLAMRKFVRNFGLREINVQPAAQTIGTKLVDIVHYRQTAEDWAKARESLLAPARTAETKLADWERTEMSNSAQPPWSPLY